MNTNFFRVIVLLLAFVILISVADDSNAWVVGNACRICQAQLSSGQTGDCTDRQPVSLSAWCDLCWSPQKETTSQEYLFYGQMLKGDDRFYFSSEKNDEPETVRYASVDHQFTVNSNQIQQLIGVQDEYFQIMSLLDSSAVKLKDIIRIYWIDSISLTIPSLPSFYRMEIFGRNTNPGPVQFQIAADSKPVGTIKFEQDNDMWSSQCFWIHPMFWSTDSSAVELSLKYTNDGFGENGSRDAYIGWIRLVPVPSY